MGFTQYYCWDRGELASMERRRCPRSWTKDVVYVCLVFFAISGSCIAQENRTRSLDTDREALERFQAAVDPTGQRLSWMSGTNPCTWTGVQCYKNRVAWLRLSGFQFTGTLPANILVDLDQLRLLSLHNNRFTGAFPVDLTNCTTLHELYLGNNLFSGPLPNFTAGMWPGLSHFDAGFNNFSGKIPASFNALRSLAVLDLENNAFSGNLPELSVNLLRFSVANNNLQGSIPASLQRFSNSSFVGNGALCGPPTTTLCPTAPPPANAPVALTPTSSPEASAPTATTISSKKRKLSVGAIAGIATSAFVVAVVFLVCLIYLFFRGCRGDGAEVENAHVGKEVTQENGRNGPPDGHGADGGADHFKESYVVSISSSSSNRSKRLQFLDHDKRPEFGLEELMQASAEVLGKGSTGTSYRADLANDCMVIVKRLKDIAADRKQFETQVEKLGRLRHRHLLPLRAYYFSRDEKLLVTDFMPRGSLHSLLHGILLPQTMSSSSLLVRHFNSDAILVMASTDNRSDDRTPLDWVSREKIALGSARALSYLHKPCVRTPHGNVKSSNVLLNRDYEPYLSDYGMTNLLKVGGASRLGGYRAPEVTDLCKPSMQSDVYSFGVVRIPLRHPIMHFQNPITFNLRHWHIRLIISVCTTILRN